MNELSSKNEENRQQSKNNKENVLQSKRFLNPIDSNGILGKYTPESQLLKKCLPAGFSQQPIYGQLMLSFSPIIFDSTAPISKSKHVIYRCHMLGYDKTQQPLFPNQITYTIHTNNKMFKNYLKDMKICIVDILDARNYQPIGHCCINWLTHMRSLTDQQLFTEKTNDPIASKYEQNPNKFFLPFIDQKCSLNLPVYDYRIPKAIPESPRHKSPQNQKLLYIKNNPHQRIIGQIQIKFASRVYENPIAEGYFFQSQGTNSQQNQKNIEKSSNGGLLSPSNVRISQYHRFSSQENVISLRNLLPDRRLSSNTVKSNYLGDNHIAPLLQRQGSNLSSQNEKSQYFKQSQKSAYQIYKQNQLQDNKNIDHYQSQVQNILKKSYDNLRRQHQGFQKNQLQLLQLKLQAQDFFNDKKILQNQKQEQKMILNIFKLKSKLQNINQLDVFISDSEDQSGQNAKNVSKKARLKIYRLENDKYNNLDFFKSKVIVDDPSQKIIQIQLPNGQGKCSFRCKDLSSGNNDICVYSKGVIIGVLTIIRQPDLRMHIPTNYSNKISSFQKPQKQILNKQSENKICIIVIDNFTQNFHKNYDVNEILNFDNYFISIKNVNFYHETLKNSKSTGQYAIASSLSIPKIFGVEVRNSGNQFVGMSQNIEFLGNEQILIEKNIMPILILQKNISIQLKQMPVFKKVPNSINFRLSLYICNTNQLNYFINKWKQKVAKIKTLEVKRQKSFSNANKAINVKQQQKIKEKQYTVSDEVMSQGKNDGKRLRTESQNINYNQINKHHIESKSSDIRESDKSRFKTQGNYTEDLQNERPSQEKQNQGNYSLHSRKQDIENQDGQQEIYLVEFFCKSLHFVLSKLGSKSIIQGKLTDLSKLSTQKQESKGIIEKKQFEKILQLLIGNSQENYQQILGFDVIEIIQALFVSEDSQMIKIQQFVLCLMAYYNFLLLLTNEKLNAFKEILLCEPDAQNKLQRIEQSITNISSEFLWDDVLPNVLEKTKKKINKRYRIYSNTPFSVHFLLKDLTLAKKDHETSSEDSLFASLLTILFVDSEKKEEIFMRTTADLGNLVRQTVEQIIFTQCLKNSGSNFDNNGNNWFQKTQNKMNQFILRQNMESISSEQKNEFFFNLTQFQEFFNNIGIETSIWESLMLIEEIKAWYQVDDFKDKQIFDVGEGVITYQLLKKWFNALKFKIQMKNNHNFLGQKINAKSSRLNSIQSVNSQEQNIIEQMNKKEVTIKKTTQNQSQFVDVLKKLPKQPINRVSTEQNPSQLNEQKYLNGKRKMTEKNSMRESQSMNNESDIANIANLLRQNENNLYFLPSMNQPNTLNKITSVKNISESDVLRGLDYNTLRNEIQALPTKKTNTIETNRLKNQKIQQSESQTDKQFEAKQSQGNYKKLNPIQGYLTITLKQIKLKKSQSIKRKVGLKKIILSLGEKSKERQDTQPFSSQNQHSQEYFFLTEDDMNKIIDNNPAKQIQRYCLKNVQIDINNVYDIEMTYSQGFSLKLLNLTAQSKNVTDNKVQELILTGILPIEDVINVVQEVKSKVSDNEYKISKRKTMVLYCGRQLNGKAVLQITVSNKINENNSFKNKPKHEDFTNISFSFLKKDLFKKLRDRSQVLRPLMSLSYCSIRDDQNLIEILPRVQENEIYDLNLPDPLVEYQLILREIENATNLQSELNYETSMNQMSFSRFTQIEYDKHKINEEIFSHNEECIIPLETLYFQKNLRSEYPLIDKLTGQFISSIEVNLQIIHSETNQQHNQ